MAIGKQIVNAIKYRLHQYGLKDVKFAQSMAIGLASDVKKIVEREHGSTTKPKSSGDHR